MIVHLGALMVPQGWLIAPALGRERRRHGRWRSPKGYGGIELARLYAGDQTVAASVGGTAPSAFGIVARDRSGRVLLASQDPRRARALGRPPLRLVRSPRGPVGSVARYPARPHAGPFEELEARGAVRGRGVAIEATHRFDPAFVETNWRVTGRAPHRVEATFPPGAPARPSTRCWTTAGG